MPSSVGSAAHTGLFIVGSRGAGGPWQRDSLRQSWCQDGHLHGDPVHVLGWAEGIYLFAGLFSLVVIKQPAPGTTASPFWDAAGHGSSGESWAGEGVLAARQGWGMQPGMPVRAAWAQGGTSACVRRARGTGDTGCAALSSTMVVVWVPSGIPQGRQPWCQQGFCLLLPAVQLGSPSSRKVRGIHC